MAVGPNELIPILILPLCKWVNLSIPRNSTGLWCLLSSRTNKKLPALRHIKDHLCQVFSRWTGTCWVLCGQVIWSLQGEHFWSNSYIFMVIRSFTLTSLLATYSCIWPLASVHAVLNPPLKEAAKLLWSISKEESPWLINAFKCLSYKDLPSITFPAL